MVKCFNLAPKRLPWTVPVSLKSAASGKTGIPDHYNVVVWLHRCCGEAIG